MFAPGVPTVMQEFHSSNESLAAFIVSVYLLGYCFGPLAIAPLSEMYGRQPLYTACNVLYTIFNVACAVAPEMGSLIVFRFFAGVAGSCPLTLGAGSLADMIPQNKRGAVMAIWAMGPLLGPVIGPVGELQSLGSIIGDRVKLNSYSWWLSDPSKRVAMDFLGFGDSGKYTTAQHQTTGVELILVPV